MRFPAFWRLYFLFLLLKTALTAWVSQQQAIRTTLTRWCNGGRKGALRCMGGVVLTFGYPVGLGHSGWRCRTQVDRDGESQKDGAVSQSAKDRESWCGCRGSGPVDPVTWCLRCLRAFLSDGLE